MRPVGEIEECNHSKDYRGSAFKDEEPAPTGEAQPAQLEQRPGCRRSDYLGDRYRSHEHRDGLCPVLVTEPVGEINDYSREETRLCRTQQKAYPIKLSRGMYEPGQDCQNPPTYHHASNPFSRAPLFDQNASWYLQQEITDEEDAAARSNDVWSKPEIAGHPQCGKADVDPVQVGYD